MVARALVVAFLFLAGSNLAVAQDEPSTKSQHEPSIIEWQNPNGVKGHAQAVFLVNHAQAWKYDVPMKAATNVLLVVIVLLLLAIRSDLAEKKSPPAA
jgi:hypothetical protein